MTSRIGNLTIFLFLAVATLFASITPTLSNLWLLATGDGYSIPTGSSLFSFQPTLMNQGSGDWWIYGRDNTLLLLLCGKRGR